MEPVKVNGRIIEPGTEFSVKGETGRFTFRWMTGEHYTCWGGRMGHEKYRTFTGDRIKRVHNKPKLRKNQKEEK